jgi:hypothetical protein
VDDCVDFGGTISKREFLIQIIWQVHRPPSIVPG